MNAIGDLTVTVDVIPNYRPQGTVDQAWPFNVRIVTRQPDGRIVGVRKLRQRTEDEATKYAEQLRTARGWA